MSCSSDFYTNNCVCDTLLAILDNQEKGNCKNNHIPVMLTCKSTCLPFTGVAAVKNKKGTSQVGASFRVSTLFRVIEVDPETCCATLELLGPAIGVPIKICDGDLPPIGTILNDLSNRALSGTGACITVDLNCFCGVTCLPPMNLNKC